MERIFLKRGSVSSVRIFSGGRSVCGTNWGVTYFVWDELRGVYCHIGGSTGGYTGRLGGLLGVYWEIGGSTGRFGLIWG
uniref:Uncharacterized protein n=1 Tax=Meloidogyne enterolobii TaxID=390850 RepID=A0A6V7YCZ3_MELEN|nr:unnamed protein product [Meloidogyne enterolobii]